MPLFSQASSPLWKYIIVKKKEVSTSRVPWGPEVKQSGFSLCPFLHRVHTTASAQGVISVYQGIASLLPNSPFFPGTDYRLSFFRLRNSWFMSLISICFMLQLVWTAQNTWCAGCKLITMYCRSWGAQKEEATIWITFIWYGDMAWPPEANPITQYESYLWMKLYPRNPCLSNGNWLHYCLPYEKNEGTYALRGKFPTP